MNLEAYDFVHLAIHAMDDKIEGKTKLQKVVYFLRQLTGNEDDLGYGPHFYGPYSGEVSGAVGQLTELRFVEARTTSWGTDGVGFEKSRTDYSLTDDGKKIAELKEARYPEEWRKMQEAARKLKQLGPIDYMKLSIAAKLYFMYQKTEGATTPDSLVQLASTFGWQISEDEIREASRHLEKLSLVVLSR